MQAVEALSVALRAVHPDVQIVLLSFSNRIGVYRYVQYVQYVQRKQTYPSCFLLWLVVHIYI